MPLYEYQCRQCGVATDVRHGFDETVSTRCPACGGELARQFSPAGIVFKGPGFYVTDSRKSAAGAKSTSKETGSGQTKPASTEARKESASSSDGAGSASAAKPAESGSKGEGTAA
jgi:putative FmdB family regulatory protein